MNEQLSWSEKLAVAFTRHFVIIEGRSESAARKYVVTSKRFFSYATERKMPLNRTTVEAWLRHLYSECGNKSNSTRASRLSAVRTVCRWLVDTGYLSSDPTDGVPSPRFSPSAARKFSTAELQALMSAPDENTVIGIRDKAILMLFYATGLRRQEMSELTLSNLQLGNTGGSVTVKGKGAKHRTVGFSKVVIPFLRKWLITRVQYAGESDPYVFIAIKAHTKTGRGKGLGIQGMHYVMKRAADTIKMRGNEAFLHKLRSTYATELYDAGHNVGEIRLLMGHSLEMTTWRYIAISQRHLEKTRIPDSRIGMIAGGVA